MFNGVLFESLKM